MMIKKFNEFVNEGTVNETPAVVSDLANHYAASKKMSQGENLDPQEMGDLITETCQAFHEDEDDTHTFEGYIGEMLKENMELTKVMEGILPNLAKKTGLSTKVADATGMPKGQGIDAD